MLAKWLVFLLVMWSSLPLSKAEVWSLSLPGKAFTTLVNTPYGLVTGEWNTQVTTNPYNGLYISKDLGSTWSNFGLQGRGITKIYYYNNLLYVTTFYAKNGESGLFVSQDKGSSWVHKGSNYSSSAVVVDSMSIYLGTYSHGLWLSQDGGNSFVQKIGTSGFGPDILAIASNEELSFATVQGKTYKSTDFGSNWTEITTLAGKTFRHVVFATGAVYLASQDNSGLYRSTDKGATWQKIESFGNGPVSNFLQYRNVLYAGRYDSSSSATTLYKSSDNGQSWVSANLTVAGNKPITQLALTDANKNYIYAVLTDNGVYKAELESPAFAEFKFLDLPFDVDTYSQAVDTITAFFDHQYPLLAYQYFTEPNSSLLTTVNFLGIEAPAPQLHYSSHSGIDFGLSYGTSIKAAANGLASYFYCKDCGYGIKIDHQNGYQTIYEHLQPTELFTYSQNIPIAAGQVLGKVGLTGRTSGPHLHFEVTKDTNANNIFSDDYPVGRVDPFGWLTWDKPDPWEYFRWTDALGAHAGSQSKYLWDWDFPATEQTLTAGSTEVVEFENKKFIFQSDSDFIPYNVYYQSYSQPTYSERKYVPNTSFLLKITDTLGNTIENFTGTVTAEINISNQDLTNYSKTTIALYYFNDQLQIWIPFDSIFDATTGILTSHVNHLSQFAVFADVYDSSPPETSIIVEAAQSNGWYTDPPKITFVSSADTAKIFYSLDHGTNWIEYSHPIAIDTNGIVTVIYQSIDSNGNTEPIREQVLRINFLQNTTKTLKITDTEFHII
jgi:murein DD-endopeptidase MepM/ murein hydrolase activator NlpD